MDVAAHITAIATRTEAETSRMTARMTRWAWPSDGGDRTDPGALEWVRRWGPHRGVPVAVACSCADGRCRVCN